MREREEREGGRRETKFTLAFPEVYCVDLIADNLLQVHNVLMIQLTQNLDLSDSGDGESFLLLLVVCSHHFQCHQLTSQIVSSLVHLSGRKKERGGREGEGKIIKEQWLSSCVCWTSPCHTCPLQSDQ